MMARTLVAPDQAAPRIAEAFKRGSCCNLLVREQRAFKEGEWLPLGTIAVPPAAEGGGLNEAPARAASFEWTIPAEHSVASDLAALLDVAQEHDDYAKIGRALDQIAPIAFRAGLLHPLFDPAAIEEMAAVRATSVVADTSAVLQGALDFVARYLYPAVRVKVPAIAHVELANLTDRFLGIRRSNARRARRGGGRLLRADELIERLRSQGGQRALLRLELQAEAEIERTYLLGDPLRSAFQPDRGGAVSDLNLSVPVRAYADQLILEAARHHQAQSQPGHAVRLLTSDQGFARMALAEGVRPLYFRAVTSGDFFGTRLSSHTFHPFNGEAQSVTLTRVLWELATAFGAARLQWNDRSHVTITTMNDQAPRPPFLPPDDLLWFSAADTTESPPPARPAASVADSGARRKDEAPAAPSGAGVSFQRMNVDRLLRLICALADVEALDSAQAASAIGIGGNRGTGDYRRFLVSAGMVAIEDGRWVTAPPVRGLAAELRNANAAAFRDALLRSPSFAAFHARVTQSEPGRTISLADMSRGAATYRRLGEMALICASVGRDLYATPARPAPGAFVRIALQRFRELDRGEGLVAAGRWLEALIQRDGIHPEVAREALQQAGDAGLLRRSAEGSAMQTDHDDHVVHVLRTDSDGTPVAMPVRLYRGDYLTPGEASVSLRIEEPS